MSSSTRSRFTALAVTTGVAIAMLGCNRSAKVAGEGRLEPEGRVLLTKEGDDPVTVARPRALRTGDTVEVVEGTAKVTLPAGGVVELQRGTVLRLNRGPELRSGDVLVTSTDSSSTMRAAGSDVGVTAGAARVTLAPSLRVVTYQGTASVRSGGRGLEVPALRSAEVSLIGLLPGRPSPLVLDRSDPWVGRFLGAAADKEAALESRARGFTNQVNPGEAASPAFYSGLLPGLPFPAEFQQDEVDRLGRSQPAAPARGGDVLVGSAIAILGQRGTFAERIAGAAAFRAEGATWALVAVDQQVPSLDALLRLIDDALNAAPLQLAAGPSVAPAAVPSEPPPAPATTRTTRRPTIVRSTPTTTPTTRRPATRSRTTTPPPPPTTSPQPLLPIEPLVESTVEPVVDLLTDLLGSR